MIIVYFTTNSGNVGRFAKKITEFTTKRIPQSTKEAENFTVDEEFVLVVPTYLGGSADEPTVAKQITVFLENNKSLLRGVVGSGNTNYGKHYCKSARLVAEEHKVPILHLFEISGTIEDVQDVEERVRNLVEQSN